MLLSWRAQFTYLILGETTPSSLAETLRIFNHTTNSVKSQPSLARHTHYSV